MTRGILIALTLLGVLLLEHTFLAPLPLPWREIPLLLLFGVVIIYRISLPLGVCFLLSGVFLTLFRGLTSWETVISYFLAIAVAVALVTRVFARRSLAALFGFALGTVSAFLVARLLLEYGGTITEGGRVTGVLRELTHLSFALFASLIAITFLSIAYTSLKDVFGRRFIRKDFAYEVEGRS